MTSIAQCFEIEETEEREERIDWVLCKNGMIEVGDFFQSVLDNNYYIAFAAPYYDTGDTGGYWCKARRATANEITAETRPTAADRSQSLWDMIVENSSDN